MKKQLVRLLTQYGPSLLAKDVMTQPVKTIGFDTTVAEAGQLMTKYGLNVFPILDERGRYAGFVSRELVQKALFHKLGKTSVDTLMQTDAYSAKPDTPFYDIESAMVQRNQRFVPIMNGTKLIGAITRTDLLRTLHDDVLDRARVRGRHPAAEAERAGGFHRNVQALLQSRLPRQLFRLLEEAGQLADRSDTALYVVGGCVRDLLLGIENFDLDLVVEGDGIAFARTLGAFRQAQVTAYERFGTASLQLPDGVKLDVATARTEYYEYPTALPTVEYSSIKKDLYRRDFTINALAIRLNSKGFGDLLDFYGGQRDLKDKVLRVLHGLSFVEDPTRVFRAIRFEIRFGFQLGRDAVVLIDGAAKMSLFDRLSGHRLLQELKLLLTEKVPDQAVKRMAELKLLRFIHPKLAWSSRLQALLTSTTETVSWYRRLFRDRKIDVWLVYMMGLMEVLPKQSVTGVLKRFPFSQSEANRMKATRTKCATIIRQLRKRPPLKPAETYRLMTGLSDETLLAIMAKSKTELVKRQVSSFLTTYQQVKPVLTGTELKAMGLKPGPQFKQILDGLLDARLNGEVKSEADERELVGRLRKLSPIQIHLQRKGRHQPSE